jgi:hypothetical protein
VDSEEEGMSMTTEHEKPKLRFTRDLSIFEMNEQNRDLSEKPDLEESMRLHKFMPSSPIQCVRRGPVKLRVIRGHSRLDYATRLGIGVWYVIDSTVTDLFELEGISSSSWSIGDFLVARAKAGDEDCRRVIAFMKQYGINQGAAISLMAGESAASGNAQRKVKQGTFRVSKDLSHATLVCELIAFCRAHGAACAGTTGFTNALSAVARVPEFDPAVFRSRIRKMPSLLARQATTQSYLEIIEDVYNYQAKGNRLNLAYRAIEVGRERRATFGGQSAQGRERGAEARKARATSSSRPAQRSISSVTA